MMKQSYRLRFARPYIHSLLQRGTLAKKRKNKKPRKRRACPFGCGRGRGISDFIYHCAKSFFAIAQQLTNKWHFDEVTRIVHLLPHYTVACGRCRDSLSTVCNLRNTHTDQLPHCFDAANFSFLSPNWMFHKRAHDNRFTRY